MDEQAKILEAYKNSTGFEVPIIANEPAPLPVENEPTVEDEAPLVEEEPSAPVDEKEVIEQVLELKSKSFEEELFERSGGKYKSLDEIELNTPYKTEFAEKLDDWIAGGGEATEFVKWNSIDPSKLDKMQVARLGLALDNPDFSEDEIEAELIELYGVADPDDESEVAKSERRLKKDVKTYAKLIEEHQAKFKADKTVRKKDVQPTASKEDIEAYQKYVDSLLADTKTTLAFGEKGDRKFSFDLKDDVKKEVSDLMLNPMQFFDRYKSEKGLNEFKQDIGLLLMIKKGNLLGALADTIKAQELERLAKEQTNAKYEQKDVPHHSTVSKKDAIIQAYMSTDSPYNKKK